jgi:hypothetical protein
MLKIVFRKVEFGHCTLNDKELDTGHNSSPNSELSYCRYNLRMDYAFSLLTLKSIKHRILATFNIKKSILTACMPLMNVKNSIP